MRRIVVLQPNAVVQRLYRPYAQSAYDSSIPQWNGGHLGQNEPPTQEGVLAFAMQASLQQARLYAAQTTIPDVPPSAQTILGRAFQAPWRRR